MGDVIYLKIPGADEADDEPRRPDWHRLHDQLELVFPWLEANDSYPADCMGAAAYVATALCSGMLFGAKSVEEQARLFLNITAHLSGLLADIGVEGDDELRQKLKHIADFTRDHLNC